MMWAFFQLYVIWLILILYRTSSQRLDVLPGAGWNNLDQTEQNRIFDGANLTDTLTSPNGIIYTLPNCFEYSRTANDDGEVTSQIVKSIDDINDFLSLSLEADASGTFGEDIVAKVSVSFSTAYRTLKRQITVEEMLLVKSFNRVSHFTIKIPPFMCKFTESFKRAVQNLADLIKNNNDQELRRQSYKFLQAFGTDFVKSITIGGIYSSESSIESSSINKTIDTDFNIKQAAEIKLALLASGKDQAEYNRSTYQHSFFSRDKSTFKRTVKGGDNSKTILTEWVKTIDNNYAVVNRRVSPLYQLFEKEYLPASFSEQFSKDYSSKLSEVVRNVTFTLYEMNARRGCMDINSENYNPSATVSDSNACKIVSDKYRFGGLFTGKCLKMKNILGGDHNCISNYTQHAVFQNVKPQFGLYFCYSDEHFSEHQSQHVYFGGIYTSMFRNPITNGYSCPPGYERISLNVRQTEVVFCLSRDVTLPTTSLYKFGGTFSSCNYYNPIANGDGCPAGYQEYPFIDDYSCAISYCMNVIADNYLDKIVYPFETTMLLQSVTASNQEECSSNGNFLHVKFYYAIHILIFTVMTTL